jgi:hypothetical protein
MKKELIKITKTYSIKTIFLVLFVIFLSGCSCSDQYKDSDKNNVQVGAYFFDGWSGRNRHADNPDEPWAKDAPTHLTRRMIEEFPEREPTWGWRGDSQEIVEKQIDLAADHGIDFFLFCWYWRDNNGPINPEAIENLSLHTQMNMYLKAKNKDRIKFGLLVANHGGSEIRGADNWGKATEFWMKYFNDPQYVTLDGKPLVVIFNSHGIDEKSMEQMQKVAKDNGMPGLSIAGCGNASVKGFTHRTHYNIIPGYADGSESHKYSELVEAHKKNWSGSEELPYIPEITVGWDKRPWEGPDGLNQKEGWYYPDRTPEQFESFINDAITWMNQHPEQTTKERMILLYAWNENGEGGYLVPTKGDPEGSYLKIVKKIK